jgi:ferritin
MMTNKAIADGVNDQIQKELASAYVYLAMSAHLETLAFPGAATWMKHQAEEELAHAMRLYQFQIDRGQRVALGALEAPPTDFGKPVDIFRAALAHEQHITRSIHDLYALAVGENDYPLQSHLQWFIDEQVEEEKTAQEIIDLLERAADNGPALLIVDQQLGTRTTAE